MNVNKSYHPLIMQTDAPTSRWWSMFCSVQARNKTLSVNKKLHRLCQKQQQKNTHTTSLQNDKTQLANHGGCRRYEAQVTVG